MVNNAGFIGPRVRIADTTAEGYRQVFDVLVLGAIFGCKHAARVMAAQGSGSIITTASIASVASGYGPHLYTAAKSALAASPARSPPNCRSTVCGSMLSARAAPLLR